MKASAKQMQERKKRIQTIEELKKVKSVLLQIIEVEEIEFVDKLKAIQLIVDVNKSLNKLDFNSHFLVETPEKAD